MRDAVSGSNAPQFWFADSSDAQFLIDSDGTGTGRIFMQAGSGSGGYGAGLILHSDAHATNPGDLHLFPSTTSDEVIVYSALGGAARLKVAMSPAAGTTSLYLYDSDNATLEQVTVGAADSGGAGYKVLRIPN